MREELIPVLIRLRLATDEMERTMAMAELARLLGFMPEMTEALKQVTAATRNPAREQ